MMTHSVVPIAYSLRGVALILSILWGSSSLFASDILLKNVVIYDGTGKKGFKGDVRIRGERIVAVGEPLSPLPDETVRDERGLALAPGFIDMHSHADEEILDDLNAETAIRQGITTALTGQDGRSRFPLADFLERLDKNPPALNVASMVGHGTLRRQVMDPRDQLRSSTAAELEKMSRLLSRELKAGGFGLSSGLEYDPGHFAKTDELIELARIAASSKGFYISHVRDEGNHVFDSFQEVLEIARKAHIPAEITHIKLAMPGVWHQAPTRVSKLFGQAEAEGIDLRADVYPYTFWQSNLRVIMLDRDFYNPEKVARALDDNGGPDRIRFARYVPDRALVGKTIAEVAQLWGGNAGRSLHAGRQSD